MDEHITIITGAAPLPPHVVAAIPDADLLIAADGGLDRALAAGLTPSGLIGDMDSVSAEGLEWASQHATISRAPTDKNQTDTELALAFAVAMNPARITLVGGGDRIDHTIAGIGALGHSALTVVPELDGWWNGQHFRVVHGPGKAALLVPRGSTLSLVAMHGPCTGVTVTNVRWPLDHVELAPLVGWGVSNVAGGPDADVDDRGNVTVEVALSTGVLTVFDHVQMRGDEVAS